MKVVASLKRICKDCYIVRRGKRNYLRCKAHPRHKRRQGFSTFINPMQPNLLYPVPNFMMMNPASAMIINANRSL